MNESEQDSFSVERKSLREQPLLLLLFGGYICLGISITVFYFDTGWPIWKDALAGSLGGAACILILHGNRLIR